MVVAERTHFSKQFQRTVIPCFPLTQGGWKKENRPAVLLTRNERIEDNGKPTVVPILIELMLSLGISAFLMTAAIASSTPSWIFEVVGVLCQARTFAFCNTTASYGRCGQQNLRLIYHIYHLSEGDVYVS
jgi:hypothetical protein